MSAKSYDLHGVRVFECAVEGPVLRNDQDAVAVIGEAMAQAARLIVIPTARLNPDFFELRTRLAGEMLQKFVNYRMRLAIIGDLSEAASNSTALRSFIHESNRGRDVWFLADMGDLEKRLASQENLNRPTSIFRVKAHNTAADSENKIHDDRVAAAHGFRGGLVPGVTVYGYMIPPVLERLGHRWLECGGMNVRFVAPCYEDDTVVARCDGSTVSAEQEDGALYASGVVTIGDGPDHSTVSLPFHPPPEMDHRPVASSATILPGTPLGSIRATLDVEDIAAIPERLLRMANEILVQNFRMSPWIHAGSEVRHHRLAACGQEIVVSGLIQECFERKGRKFAVAGIEMSADDESSPHLIATVRHTFIYGL